jgi:hypothetical protein
MELQNGFAADWTDKNDPVENGIELISSGSRCLAGAPSQKTKSRFTSAKVGRPFSREREFLLSDLH